MITVFAYKCNSCSAYCVREHGEQAKCSDCGGTDLSFLEQVNPAVFLEKLLNGETELNTITKYEKVD